MARFYQVSPLFWSDEKVVRWPDDSVQLALYFLTCRHRIMEGLYRLPLSYIDEDLGWAPEKREAAMDVLLEAEFIAYDHEAKVVFLCNALKYQAPKSQKQITGAINALQAVPPTDLMERLVEAAKTHADDFYNALIEAGDTHSNGSGPA